MMCRKTRSRVDRVVPESLNSRGSCRRFWRQDGETDGLPRHTSSLDEVINLKLERNELHRLDRVPREHRVVIRA